MKDHQGLPVSGYRPQSDQAVKFVNSNKRVEEKILRLLDDMKQMGDAVDQRWVAIGRTHIEEGFMAINRAVFMPARVSLPEDEPPAA